MLWVFPLWVPVAWATGCAAPATPLALAERPRDARQAVTRHAEVIAPRHGTVLEARAARSADHVDRVRLAVPCEQGSGTPGATPGARGSGEPPVSGPRSSHRRQVAKAIEDLAGRLSVPVDRIRVLEVREVTWPDSSLGCPQPGMAYAQGLQEGLLIRLGAGRRMYFYHGGGAGDPFLCERSSQMVPRPTRPDERVPPPDWEID